MRHRWRSPQGSGEAVQCDRQAGADVGAVMKERPIIFSAPMIRAILAGTKTQTRRAVKPQPSSEWCPKVGTYHPTMIDRYGEEYPGAEVYGASDEREGRVCPYGQPGDRLWVRETWC